jgi:rubrerythrin
MALFLITKELVVTGRNKVLQEELQQPEELCPKCGSILATEEGIKFCPHCEGDIDYFGEDEDEL